MIVIIGRSYYIARDFDIALRELFGPQLKTRFYGANVSPEAFYGLTGAQIIFVGKPKISSDLAQFLVSQSHYLAYCKDKYQ